MADRARRYESGLRDEWGLPVQAGPFAGMRYPHDLRGVDHALHKLLGRYEHEIQPAVERMAQRRVFVDFGSADGYYAVGMARRGLDVYAFDLASSARKLAEQVARLNGVTVRQRRRASLEGLLWDRGPGLLDDAAVLCDIEGAEADLFDDWAVERLASAMVVIETHEHIRPGVTDLLLGRFGRGEVIRPEVPRAGDTRWLVIPAL